MKAYLTCRILTVDVKNIRFERLYAACWETNLSFQFFTVDVGELKSVSWGGLVVMSFYSSKFQVLISKHWTQQGKW